jgi:hypothetical protein
VDVVDVRRVSHRLFGNTYRLEVVAAIGRSEGKLVNVRGLVGEAILDYNRLQEQVSYLASAGLLVPEFDPLSRYKDYRPIESSFWRLAATLLDELRDRDGLP